MRSVTWYRPSRNTSCDCRQRLGFTVSGAGVGMMREGGMSRLMAGARKAYFSRLQVSRPLLSTMRP